MPLHLAAEVSHRDGSDHIEILVEANALMLKQPDKEGLLPVHRALKANAPLCNIKALVAQYPEVAHMQKHTYIYTCIHISLAHSHT